MGEIQAIKDESGKVVIAILGPQPAIRDQRNTGDSHGSANDVHYLRAMAKAALVQINGRVFDVPRPSTPKDAAIVRTDRPLPLKARKKKLAKLLKKSS